MKTFAVSVDMKEFLDVQFLSYNNTSFISNDPIFIPHQYVVKQDIEIAGFLTSTIAWGQRLTILKNSMRLMELMSNQPFDFIINFKENDLKSFKSFIHRTYNGEDCMYFLIALQHIYKHLGGLNNIFFECLNVHNQNIGEAISTFRNTFFEFDHLKRTLKHVGDPMRNSSAKRICLFLRWMVRRDHHGVDFGLWKNISPAVLAMPLDLHSARVARSLGLLKRKQNDWKAVMELTDTLRKFDPDDPVKYDFALFGLGVNEKFK